MQFLSKHPGKSFENRDDIIFFDKKRLKDNLHPGIS